MRLDSVKFTAPFWSGTGIDQRYYEDVRVAWRAPILSSTPWNEPVRPVVEVIERPPHITTPAGRRTVVEGTYTIAGADGAILETRRISIVPSGLGTSGDERSTARYLARRVAKMTRTHAARVGERTH